MCSYSRARQGRQVQPCVKPDRLREGNKSSGKKKKRKQQQKKTSLSLLAYGRSCGGTQVPAGDERASSAGTLSCHDSAGTKEKKRVEWRAETMQSTSPRLKFPNVDTGLSNVDYNVSSAVLTGP